MVLFHASYEKTLNILCEINSNNLSTASTLQTNKFNTPTKQKSHYISRNLTPNKLIFPTPDVLSDNDTFIHIGEPSPYSSP